MSLDTATAINDKFTKLTGIVLTEFTKAIRHAVVIALNFFSD